MSARYLNIRDFHSNLEVWITCRLGRDAIEKLKASERNNALVWAVYSSC